MPADIPRRLDGTGESGTPQFGHFAPTGPQKLLIALANATPLGRGRARWQVSALLEKLRPGPIDIEHLGFKLRLHHYGDNYSEKKLLLHSGHYDRPELTHLLRHLRPQFHFADVGANIGYYSFAVKSRCPDARIAAFEPSPIFFDRMEYNVRINRLQDFFTIRAAAGADRGRGQFHFREGGMIGAGQSLEVDVVPLHEALQEKGFGRLDALKIDVEGYEDRVLFPYFETTSRDMHPRSIAIEHAFQPRWQRDCLALLTSQGYREVWHGELNSVFERPN